MAFLILVLVNVREKSQQDEEAVCTKLYGGTVLGIWHASLYRAGVHNWGKSAYLGGHLVVFENLFHCHNLEEENAITDLQLVQKKDAIKYSKVYKEWFDPTYQQWRDWEITTADKINLESAWYWRKDFV